MNRQEYNYKIIGLLLNYGKISVNLYNNIKKLIDKYPQQRFGQIICNYICPDYREDLNPFMKMIFNISYDPFFEESSETFKRLKNDLC